MTRIKFQIIRTSAFLFGVLNWLYFVLLALKDGQLFKKTSMEAHIKLRQAQERLWDASNSGQYVHKFYTGPNGRKLHYVVASMTSKKAKNLVIFLHGFPDSWALWRNLLRSKRLRDQATLIAIDLPAYGGSDNLDEYDATSILELLSSCILTIRKIYIPHYAPKENSYGHRPKVIVVSHDWGAIAAFRLSAEAPSLADRYIMTNSVLPQLIRSNALQRFKIAYQLLKCWLRKPWSHAYLRIAITNFTPVLRQTFLSGYIFMFNLPTIFPRILSKIGDFWFLRIIHKNAAGGMLPLSSDKAADALAASLGPAPDQCNEPYYSEFVRRRVKDGPLVEQIRYYREGFAFGKWLKSAEITSALNELTSTDQQNDQNNDTHILELKPKGALNARSTIIWGVHDIALDMRMALSDIENYLPSGSCVVTVPKSGHWLPLNEDGESAIEESILWALSTEDISLSIKLMTSGLQIGVPVEL